MSEQMQGEIAELSAQIAQQDDPRAGFALIQARIRSLRADGITIPAELIRMERNLQSECICESRGG